jgi:PPOX class probable F420-dependent enzyme
MTPEEARGRFAAARVGRLATADRTGRPHLVPVVFAVHDGVVVSAVDHKPKQTTALRRLANIAGNPRVALLVDEYGEDWSQLWWARADGKGRIVDTASNEGRWAIELLLARYPQYRDHRPTGPVLVVDVKRWSGWSAAAGGRSR